MSNGSTRFSLACNFDPALFTEIRGYPVYEVFGKLPVDVLGGGRPSAAVPFIGRKDILATVKLAHESGIEFNYLLNASCTGNIEYTPGGLKKIRKLLDWLSELGVDTVTLNHPMLLKVVKSNYRFKVRVGIFSGVNTPQRAKFWENEGADSITLDDLVCNRDFELLAALRAAVKCDLQLLANNICMSSCFMAATHMNMVAHGSRPFASERGCYIDYCSVRCMAARVREPVNFIRSGWIRPEDMHHYEKLGYTNFKICDRSSPTRILALRVKAYTQRKYEGNLMDLICSVHPRDNTRKRSPGYFWTRLRHFLSNPAGRMRFREFSRLHARMAALDPQNPVKILNQDLDHFLDMFLAESCSRKDCETCRYCHSVAARCVRIDPEYAEEYLKVCEALSAAIEKGDFIS